MDLGVVELDGLRDLLDDHRLAGLGRGDDEAALALAHGGDQVDDAGRVRLRGGLHAQLLGGVQRRELAELAPGLGLLRRHAVDGVDAHERVVLLALALALAGQPHGARDGVPGAKPPSADVAQGDVDVVGPGQVAGCAHEGVVLLDVEDARDGRQLVVAALAPDPLAAVLAVAALAPFAVGDPIGALELAPAGLFAALALGLGRVVALGQFDVEDGLHRAGPGVSPGLLGGGGQVDGDPGGLDGALGHGAPPARAAGARRGARRVVLFPLRAAPLLLGGGRRPGRVLRGSGRRLSPWHGILRGRSGPGGGGFGGGASVIAQQLDELGFAQLGDSLEAAALGERLEFRQLHGLQRLGRCFGGCFVAHEGSLLKCALGGRSEVPGIRDS